MQLARRPDENVTPTPDTGLYTWTLETPTGCRDFVVTQDVWDKYVSGVGTIFHPLFWEYFLRLHTLSHTAIDTVLSRMFCRSNVKISIRRYGTISKTRFPTFGQR